MRGMAKRFVDIGVNLTDEMFQGIYNNRVKHQEDLRQVLERGRSAGVTNFIATAGTVSDSFRSLEFCHDHSDVYTTVGVHPTQCQLFVDGETVNEKKLVGEELLLEMKEIITKNKKVIAVGECGLDYDRLQFCSKEIQIQWFTRQFELAIEFNLPMFLHMRNAGEDFIKIMKEWRGKIKGGVVHSFTGTIEEMEQILALDLFIGINGCSLKTEENLKVVKQLPLDRLMLETDAPWCGIRPSSAAAKYIKTNFPSRKKERFQLGECVKDRNEPCFIVQVAEVIAAIKEVDLQEVVDNAYANSTRIFFPSDL